MKVSAYAAKSSKSMLTQYSFERHGPLNHDVVIDIHCYSISPLIHWKASAGKKAAIIGLGGLGHLGVKMAHAIEAEVTVLSHTLKKQQEGKKMEPDRFIATSDPGELGS